MAKRKAKKIDRIKISACYIVKNAAEDLRRSLESLARYVDEIIIVDTGSTDNTIAVAKKFGAKIFYEPWQDDFATPRNIALREAKGDWIVFLDADEFFVNGTAKNLQAAIKRAQSHGVQGISVRWINVDADNGYKIIKPDYALRIFENAQELHYVGKIHETIYLGEEIFTNIAAIPADMFTLWHTGYSTTIVREKFERNLKLLLEELNTSDKPERTYFYLADCYYGLGDWTNAEKFARMHINAIQSQSTRSLRILIDILEEDPSRSDELFEVYQLAVKLYPTMPEFSYELAYALAERGDYRAASEEMQRAIDKFKNYGEQVEATEFDALTAESARHMIAIWSVKISACYIVKNSANDLRRSLESLANQVDEIIVVDTGSTDDTIAVAESFGAKIFREPWQNDFATPRNIALREAKGDWIVFLDADEFFIDDTAKNLRDAIRWARNYGVQGVFVKLVNVDADNDYKILGSSHVLRLYKNVEGIHYVGKIHEQVFIGDKLLTRIMQAHGNNLTIWHTGYSASISRAKTERNLNSLLEELAVTDNPKRIYGYLAECYHALGDMTNAEKFARLDFDSGATLSKNSTAILLDCLSKNPAQVDDFLKYLRLAVERYPYVPEFSAKLAEVLAEHGDYRAAVDEMNRAIEHFYNRGDELESSSFDGKTLAYVENLLADWQKKIVLTPEEKSCLVSELTDELIYDVEDLRDKKEILKTAEKLFALQPDEPAPVERIASIYVDYKMEDKAETVIAYLEKNFPPSPYRLLMRARLHFLKENCLETIKVAERALTLEGGDLVTQMLIHNLLGQAYRFIGDVQKAIVHYNFNAKLNLDELKDSPHFAQAERIRREEYSNYLFNLHCLNVSREKLFEETRGFNELLAHIPRFKHNRNKHAKHKKIRVGYISPDVRFHVVAFFSSHFFISYDKTHFEVFIYANNAADNVTQQFKEAVDCLRFISGMPANDVAAQIVRDEIDILVDLAGHTSNNSLEVLAYKPAPIQISGVGYMNSTGLDTVDYFIADKFTDPVGLNEKFFTEKILRLQHSHFCYVWHDLSFHVTPAPCTKNGFVTFVSFNNFAKVTDEMLKAWGKILNAVPNSRLYIKHKAFRENCGFELARERMTAAGIDLERVDFEDFEVNYVRCYERADIALDTFPYPGGGTTCDALYMGVPVITLVGERHNSRFGYSLLVNMGLEELCAFSVEEYVQKAIALANDREHLREYHLTLRRKMELSPVMNDAIYMGEVEQAYEKIFSAWLNKKSLPDFPQETAQVTEKLAEEYIQRANYYIPLENKNGKSAFNRVDFKRTLYYAELAAQCESKRNPKLFLTIADRRHMLDDNLGAYKAMHKAIEYLPVGKEYSEFFLAECHKKLATYAQNNRRHVEAIENYARAFELTSEEGKRLEIYDGWLLSLHFIDISSAEMAAVHFDYQKFFEDVKPFTTYHKRHARIKVGYISGDFRKHAAFSVVFGFISCHDRSKFEITCYSRNVENDNFTELFKRAVDNFIDVRELSDAQIAKKIHDDEIDIVVDLAGHTGCNGLPALVYRPAPVQISGIGYMSTTGLKEIDYFITDAVLDPPNQNREQFFSEKFLYMPAQFSYAQPVNVSIPEGAPCVKNGYVTFGTICRYSKITDDMLAVWTEILNRVPSARLLMRAQEFISNSTVDELYSIMKNFGCDMDRVIIRPAIKDYFGAISQLDICLDSYPYVGGATTLDALYMGVPVITLYGERHSTRFGRSILNSVGLSELAVDNVDAYINTAVALAKDFETLDLLHKNLRGMFLNSDALNPQKYCRLLEQKFTEILGASYEKFD